MEFYGSLEDGQEQSFKWKLSMENRAHAAEMTTLEDADTWDKKRLPRKVGKIKTNCGLGSVAWSFGGPRFITKPCIKWQRCLRWESWQRVARAGCAQPGWEGAQAPLVRVLISYFLLPVPDEHELSLLKSAV